jgi:hypothetical protein
VRHDVVQLAGDAGAFGGHGDRGLLVPFGLQQPQPGLQFGVVGAAGADELAQRPREAVDGGGADAQPDVGAPVRDPPDQVA